MKHKSNYCLLRVWYRIKTNKEKPINYIGNRVS